MQKDCSCFFHIINREENKGEMVSSIERERQKKNKSELQLAGGIRKLKQTKI